MSALSEEVESKVDQFGSDALIGQEGSVFLGEKLAPYNPTNIDCVHLALGMMKVVDSDVLFDLGCGDGRFLVEAGKLYGIPSVGVEYDRDLCVRARENVEFAGLSDKIVIHHASVVDVDISTATVVFVYLVPAGVRAVRAALLEAIERGARVVTYVFSIPDMEPTEVQLYKKSTKLFLYSKSIPQDEITDRSSVVENT